MTTTTKEALGNFASLHTYSSGHPSDRRRLYQFVAVAYRQGDRDIQFSELKSEIEAFQGESVNDDIIMNILAIYNQCIEAINVYNEE